MDKEKLSHIFTSISLSQGEKISDVITKYRVSILYAGPNRNGSNIEKDVVDKMCETAGGIPIIGYYSKDEGDFTSHFGQYITKVINTETGATEDEYLDTVPYGFLPTNPEFSWEDKVDDDGITRTYLMSTVYLWDGRYEALNVLHTGRPNNLSMELNPATMEGDWITLDSNGNSEQYYNITKADFIGLCILGKDVEPCFQGAEFTPMFSLEQEGKIKNSLVEMGNELKAALAALDTSEVTISTEETAKLAEEPTKDGDIVLTPEDISESKENFVFEKKEKEEEEEPTEEELEAIEAEEVPTEAEEVPTEDSLEESDTDTSVDEPTVTLEQLETENLELRNNLAALKDSYSALQTEYTLAKDKLDLIDARKDKFTYLDGEKDNLDKTDYEAFVKNVDKFTLEEFKNEITKSGFEYLKKLKNQNSTFAASEPTNAVIYNFEDDSNALKDAPDWVKEVKKTQEKD